jgi:hypothetical protein
MLFVSELAACIGRHKYQPPEVAMAKCWRRLDPKAYHAAEARAGVQIQTDEDVVAELGLDLATATAAKTEGRATALAAKLLAQPVARATRKTVQCAQAALALPDLATRATALETTAVVGKQTLSASAAQKRHQQALELAALGRKATPAQIKRFIEAAKVRDSSAAAASVQSAINKQRGTANERPAIKKYEAKTKTRVTGKNDVFYKQNVGTADAPCWIGGRVDGLAPNKVVEVKCRRNRFFTFLPAYEKVQIHAYMALTHRHSCDLVQKFNGAVRVKTHQFDADYWDEVCEEICEFGLELQQLMRSTRAQDELLEAQS